MLPDLTPAYLLVGKLVFWCGMVGCAIGAMIVSGMIIVAAIMRNRPGPLSKRPASRDGLEMVRDHFRKAPPPKAAKIESDEFRASPERD